MNLLVTGGLGFIGSHFIEECLKDKKIKKIVNLDLQTYAANLNLSFDKNYIFIKEDINSSLIGKILRKYEISHIAHLAAESHVDNSIKNPSNFITTNINGTFNLLKFCVDENVKKFLHVSTDEVFGSLDKNQDPFDKNSNYKPNNPYSASKAASDMLVRSFSKTYKLNAIITNCSNNFGPRQHKEKMIPVAVNSLINKNPIPLYGDGENIRDWIYVKDHVRLLKKILLFGSKNRYLIGGENEISNLDLIIKIKNLFEKIKKIKIDYSWYKKVEDRKSHDYRYAISNKSIKKEYKLKLTNFGFALENTIKHYIQ